MRAPRKGSVIVIEFSDGMHEYVTTPVKRVLRLAARDVFYIETVNSRYRLEVRDLERDKGNNRKNGRLGLASEGRTGYRVCRPARLQFGARQMGRFDRRKSWKMRQRRAQRAKKEREQRAETTKSKPEG